MALFPAYGVGPNRIGPVDEYFSRLLDTNGNGTGEKNAIGDYSATPTDFLCKAPAGKIMRISRLLVHIEDAGLIRAEGYGAITSGLTNGIEVRTELLTVPQIDMTDGVLVKSNADWGRFCYDIQATEFGVGNNFVQVRWTFARGGVPIRLRSTPEETLVVRLNDDFSDLVSHHFAVQGYFESDEGTGTTNV